MIKAIIFDVGGVVLKPKSFRPLTREYAKLMGRDGEEVHKIFKKYWHEWKFGKISEEEFFEGMGRDLGVKVDKNKLRELMYSFPELDRNVVSLIQRLRRKYEIFSLTNHAKEFFEFLEGKYGLGRLFDCIFKSYEAKLAKPDPRFFEWVMEEIGRKPEECVFIDDREENVEAARVLGMNAILYEDVRMLEKELRKLGIIF